MKVGNPADEPSGPAPASGPKRSEPATPAKPHESGASAADPSAKVELSNAASSLLSGSANSDFDADKVARIAQAITDGKFEINAEKIADRLLANANEVLGKSH